MGQWAAAAARRDRQIRRQALYAEVYFQAGREVVVKSMDTMRFKRLKGPEATEVLLAKALTLPDFAPGYAEQKLRACGIS